MNHLEVIFTGIVYLLGTADHTGGKVTAILPAISAPSAPFGQLIPGHVAYIKVRKGHVDPTSSPTPTFRYTEVANRKFEYLVFILGRTASVDTITITPASDDPAKLVICKARDCLNNRLPYNEVVAHREVICPKCLPIEPTFVTTELSDLVAARMVIESGYLASAKPPGPPGPPEREWTTWHIKPPKGVAVPITKQKLSEKVSLDLTATGAFKLVVTALDATGKPIPIFSADLIKDASQNDDPSIEIGNMSLAEVLDIGMQHDEPVDHHFGLFYTMLQQPLPAAPPVPTKPPHPATLGPTDNCPPMADETGG
jgi:hypothetical protein